MLKFIFESLLAVSRIIFSKYSVETVFLFVNSNIFLNSEKSISIKLSPFSKTFTQATKKIL